MDYRVIARTVSTAVSGLRHPVVKVIGISFWYPSITANGYQKSTVLTKYDVFSYSHNVSMIRDTSDGAPPPQTSQVPGMYTNRCEIR